MSRKVEHVIVLMMENRSFDHVLGFLDHPDPAFEGLTGEETNPWRPGEPARVTDTGTPAIAPGPDHSHPGVMTQIFGEESPPKPYRPTNQGFARNFEEHALRELGVEGRGPQIMRCLPPERAPVLGTLAREFAVCDHWFCSVPGETWPNRNFAHAATADGEVEIVKRFYHRRTIFQLLDEAGRQWAIYHHGMPQTLVFPYVWERLHRNRVRPHGSLLSAIRHDKLPHYSFVEPRHFPPRSESQHPDNNRKDPKDFIRGERLIAEIYEALVSSPRVWAKTLFVVTYDEHGGYYDHLPPPHDPKYRDGRRHEESGFDFDLLGPRVPAVLVSPWIPRATLDSTVYDHASIPATLRALFAPDAEPLTPRDAVVNTFHHNLSLGLPRDGGEVPRFPRDYLEELLDEAEEPSVADLVGGALLPLAEMDGFQRSLVELAEEVDASMRAEEGEGPGEAAPAFTWKTRARVDRGAGADLTDALEETVSVAGVDLVAERVRATSAPTTDLRTPAGDSVRDPSREQMWNAIGEARAGSDADANVWIADQDERSVTAYGDGRVVFLDAVRDVSREARVESAEEALRLFELIRAGRADEVERALGG